MASHAKWRAYTTGVAVFAAAFLITFLAASVFIPVSNSSADTNSSSNTSADGYSLSLSATSNVDLNLIVSHVDTMTVSLGNINVQTTSPGYKLYIGMTGSTTSLNSTSNTIPATTGSLIAPVSLTRGSWGYAIPSNTTHLVSSGFNSEYATISSNVPDTSKRFAVPPASSSNPQLLAVSTSATSAAGDDYPIYYGVRANSDTPAGTYTNNVMFTAVADAGASNTLTLTPNNIAANVATRVEVKTTMYSTASDLDADVYLLTRAQYNSLSGTNVEALGISPLTCTKTSSTPLTYSCLVPKSVTGDYNIYVKSARYDQVYANTFTVNTLSNFFTISNMQQMTYAICSSVPTPPANATADEIPTTILADSRDTNSYTVKKLADGRCWMTENLRIKGKTLTPSDSNVTTNFNLPSEASGSSYNTAYVYDSGNASYGVYYSFFAATAGAGTTSLASGEASSSICPKGWRLPTGGSYTSDFYNVFERYNSVTSMLDTTNGPGFILSGLREGSSTGYQGDSGFYWSSTAKGSASAYNLALDESSVYYLNNNDKRKGFNVRCVSNYDFWDIQNMQDMIPYITTTVTTPSASATTEVTSRSAYNAVADKTTVVPTRTLTDARDGKTYQVKKLADGKIWMTQNLYLTKTMTLTSADSDVVDNYAIEGISGAQSLSTGKAYDYGDATFGAYYDWYTATATTVSGDTYGSVCPKGWRLPSGGGDATADFLGLYNAGYNTSALIQKTTGGPAFVLSGTREGDTSNHQNSLGYYWSSTAYPSGYAHDMRLTNSIVVPNTYDARDVGMTVRCLAK